MASSTERERDRYIEWLRARGASEEDLASHGVYAEMILVAGKGRAVQSAHVRAAVERERAAGAPESRLANLERVGVYLQQFQREDPDPDTADFEPPEPEMDTQDIALVTPPPRPGRISAGPPVAVAPAPAPRRTFVYVLVAIVLVVAVAVILVARSG